jgi:hypothetical protein
VRQPESAAGNLYNEAPQSFRSSAQNINNPNQHQFEIYRESSVHLNENQRTQAVGATDHRNRTTLNAIRPPSNHCFTTQSEKGAPNSTPANRVQTSSMHSVNEQNQNDLYNSFSRSNQGAMEKQKQLGSIGLFRENKNSTGTKTPWSKE